MIQVEWQVEQWRFNGWTTCKTTKAGDGKHWEIITAQFYQRKSKAYIDESNWTLWAESILIS